MKAFIGSLEERKMRIFNKELNLHAEYCCCEYALIRRNWGLWNAEGKQKLLPL